MRLSRRGSSPKPAGSGRRALLESPLSLRLLRTVVVKDQIWPTSRFELFDRAVRQFSYEHDPVHAERDDRHPPATILAAADRTALLLLSTGAKAVWRSNAPPAAAEEQGSIPTHALGLPTPLVNDMLDTPLFAGESVWFEPMHRAVAEFMAARALERFLTLLDRMGFPRARFSDSGSLLVLEASTDGTSIVGGSSEQGSSGDCGWPVAQTGGGSVRCERGKRDPLAAARDATRHAEASAAGWRSAFG